MNEKQRSTGGSENFCALFAENYGIVLKDREVTDKKTMSFHEHRLEVDYWIRGYNRWFQKAQERDVEIAALKRRLGIRQMSEEKGYAVQVECGNCWGSVGPFSLPFGEPAEKHLVLFACSNCGVVGDLHLAPPKAATFGNKQ